MPRVVIENPILNSTFEEPKRHYLMSSMCPIFPDGLHLRPSKGQYLGEITLGKLVIEYSWIALLGDNPV